MYSPEGNSPNRLWPGLGRFLCALRWAKNGLAAVWRDEEHFRWQTVIAALVLSAARWTGQSRTEFAILVLISGTVMAAQVLNWVCEMLADLIVSEPHPVIRDIKDGTAGMVLILSVCSVVVFFLLLWPDLNNLVPFFQYAWRQGQWWEFLQLAGLVILSWYAFWGHI